MSDILIQSALKEQQRLTGELIQAQKDSAIAAAGAALNTAIAVNEEIDMISAGTYAYQCSWNNFLCSYPTSTSGAFPAKNLLCYRDDPAKQGEAVEAQYCKAFHQLWKPRPHGFLCHDTEYGRCGRSGNFTVPAGVSKVQVQMWGPGSGSGGFCCQGFSMPGPAAAYMLIDNLEVKQGDTLCFCAGCAYCCYGDGTGAPGLNNGYCTSLCFCDQGVTSYEFYAPGAPEPHVCRWSCSWCMKNGWSNCCPMQFGGNWFIDDDMEINTQGGCACSIGAGFACVAGVNSCSGCWSICYDSPGDAKYMPMVHDHNCIGYSSMTPDIMRQKNTRVYNVPALWPSFATDRVCCLGGPYNSGDHWVIAPPVPGFSRSFRVSSNYVTKDRSTQTPFGQCCRSNQCFGELSCQGVQRFPGVGGSGYATTGTNQLGCGDYGGGGAICISWACNNEAFDPFAPW
jgi:hypothetical protein